MTPAIPATEPHTRAVGRLKSLFLSEYLVLWLSLIYFVLLAPFTPGFATANNLANILITLLPLFVVAIGQTIVLITGGIDLSVTSVIALASVIGAILINTETGWLAGHALATPTGVVSMLLVGVAVGTFNGIAVALFRMPAFIVTLTTMMFFSGFAIWLTRSKAINNLPASFVILGGQLAVALLIALALGTTAHLLLNRSLYGRWLYAAGHNARTALVSGIPVNRVIIGAYALSGFCAAVAAILYTGQSETGSPVLGQRILLDIIGATVIGGTSLFGGKGKILWTLFGVLFLKLIDNSLNLLSLSFFTVTMVKGGVILFAAVLDVFRKRLRGGDAS